MRNGQNTVVGRGRSGARRDGLALHPLILDDDHRARPRQLVSAPAEHVGADDFGQDVGKPARPLAVAWGHDVQPAAVGYGAAVAALRSLLGVKRTSPRPMSANDPKRTSRPFQNVRPNRYDALVGSVGEHETAGVHRRAKRRGGDAAQSRAQQTSLPAVGFLHSASAEANQKRRAAFLDGLTATGYVAGRNVTIEYRWADGEFVRLPLLAEQLVRHPVSVLVAFAPPTVLAARTATATIPIVFFMGGDPVKLGLVQSFSRPGGNITGIAAMTISLVAKRLELIRSLVPHADTVAFVFNPSNPTAAEQLEAVHSAAQSLGQNVIELGVRNETELEALANTITRVRPKALVIGADSFLISQRNKLVALAARHSLPAIYETRNSVVSGGLVSYAPDFDDGYRQTGIYVGRILKGERPADLPVVQPTKFELVINLKTAKALGITVPLTLQASADEVIE